MNRMLALLLGSSVFAVSLPTFAVVSNVFVSNTGDSPPTLSLIRCVTSNGKNPIKCEEMDRQEVGFGTSWPANQYDGHPAWWWTGLSGEIIGIKAKASLSPLKDPDHIVHVDTYSDYTVPGGPASGANFIGISPDGRTAWNSAREVDQIQEIDTDPGSPTFGTILTAISVPDLDPDPFNPRARPCDATITPDGRYFFEPDLGGESMTVVDTHTRSILHQVKPCDYRECDPEVNVQPFMATTNGKIVLVENLEGDNTYDIWDVSVLPAPPLHLKTLVQDDGLGVNAQTSEFTRDGRYAYLIMNGVADADPSSFDASHLDVLDVMVGSSTYLTIVDTIELPYNCRAHTGDFSNDGRYFFVNCSGSNELAVVDTETRTVVTTVAVGAAPRGVVVR